MNVITIPKRIAQGDDLVIIPRRDYEELLSRKPFKEFTPTKAQT